jgi:type II secretory pathway component PulF
MENDIYRSPKSQPRHSDRTTDGWKLFRTIVYGLVSICIYFSLGELVTQFGETFSAFGSELPGLTIIAIKLVPYYKWIAYLSILIFIAFLVSVFVVRANAIIRRIVKYNCVVALILFVVCIVAMYLPIFVISSAV